MTMTTTIIPVDQCPYHHGQNTSSSSNTSKDDPKKKKPMTVRDWWPDSIDLRILHQDPIYARPCHVPHPTSATVGAFTSAASAYASYANNFARLDLNALRNDIYRSLTTSHPSWPADYGHYGPLLIRLAWHSAGTYRV